MSANRVVRWLRGIAGLAIFVAGMTGVYELVSRLMRFWFGVMGPAAWLRVVHASAQLSKSQHAHLVLIEGAALILSLMTFVAATAVAAYRVKVSAHGDARFATAGEIAEAGFHKVAPKSLLLGQMGKKFLYSRGTEWVSLIAPPRSGKGVGCVIPNLLNYSDSAVVIDIRGEAYIKTSGFRQENGQAVFVWQPYSDDIKDGTHELDSRSHRYNPFAYVGTNPATRVGDLRDIMMSLLPNNGTENDFFRGGAREIATAIGLYLMESGARLTFGEIRKHSQGYGSGRPLRVYLPELIKEADEKGLALSDGCRALLRGCVNGAEETVSSYIKELDEALSDWDNPIVVAATDANDFDFRDLRRKRMTVYVVVEPFKLPVAAKLLNLFFSQLIGWNMRERPEDDPSIKYECLLMLDEFTAPGKITILGKAFGYMAGYGLKVVSVTQNQGQIEEVYGKEITKSYLDAHAVTVVFPPRHVDQAETISRQLGNYTLRVESKSHGGKGGGVNVNESEMGRALLMPQELSALALEKKPVELIFSERALPIKCERIVYYKDARFAARDRKPVEIPSLSVELDYYTPNVKAVDASIEKVSAGDVAPETLAQKYDPVKSQLNAAEDTDYQAWKQRHAGRNAAAGADPEDAAFFARLADRLFESGVLQS